MQPTVPPWAWVTWERRSRARASPPDYRSHVRLLPRARDDHYTFYGLPKDSRHFIRSHVLYTYQNRLLDSLGKLLNRPWAASSAPVTWRVDHYHDADAWRGHDLKSFRPYEPVSIVLPASGGAAGHLAGEIGAVGAGGAGGAEGAGADPGGTWGSAARGWAAAALVLALLLMLVRAAENCLHKRLFKAIYMHTNLGAALHQQETMQGQYIYTANGVRRQESDEWSTPNVTATSHTSEDLPPPYSACAGEGAGGAVGAGAGGEGAGGGGAGGVGGGGAGAEGAAYKHEEPPPPYSACIVSYSRPKDGDPAVRIHNPRQRARHAAAPSQHTSIDIDNAQNDLIESGQLSALQLADALQAEIDSLTRTELIFDNGRVIERVSLDDNSPDDEDSSNGDVEQAGEAGKDRVVYVNETAPAAAARALLV
ncbi:unnamed protein product [Chrysodeixis includens]|uniref:Uncharacterized protein n=1 Tax=Chrysodeixis includens TaxID=689277 RepID=A0A9P0C096_CHRIL|nr:unnamed protein product [Chrysodeixis includens]